MRTQVLPSQASRARPGARRRGCTWAGFQKRSLELNLGFSASLFHEPGLVLSPFPNLDLPQLRPLRPRPTDFRREHQPRDPDSAPASKQPLGGQPRPSLAKPHDISHVRQVCRPNGSEDLERSKLLRTRFAAFNVSTSPLEVTLLTSGSSPPLRLANHPFLPSGNLATGL